MSIYVLLYLIHFSWSKCKKKKISRIKAASSDERALAPQRIKLSPTPTPSRQRWRLPSNLMSHWRISWVEPPVKILSRSMMIITHFAFPLPTTALTITDKWHMNRFGAGLSFCLLSLGKFWESQVYLLVTTVKCFFWSCDWRSTCRHDHMVSQNVKSFAI